MSIVLLFLLASPLFIHVASAQPSAGNWVVTGTQVVQNESITLNGNLTVENGGNLTLRNVNLALNMQYNGEYGISVQPGGSLYIYGSTINSTSGSRRLYFVVNGSNFVLAHSSIHDVGWCSPGTIPGSAAQVCVYDSSMRQHAGLVVESDGAIISDNVISNNGVGVIVSGSHERIDGNKFGSDDVFTLGGSHSSFDAVFNNTFEQNPVYPLDDAVVYFNSGQNDSFSKNTFLVDDSLIQENSTLINGHWGLDGLKIDSSLDDSVTGNNISAVNIAVFLIDSQDSVVNDNNMTFGEGGVGLLGPCVNTRVIGNTLDSFPYVVVGGAAGISANFAHNSVFANNVISYARNTPTNEEGLSNGIDLDHTSNSSIINNRILATQSGSFESLTLLGSKGNYIAGNTLSQSVYGILLSALSDGNTITSNEVQADHSVTILGSSSNTLYLNNFYDVKGSTGGPYDNGQNQWSNGSAGNYWSYFTGQDQNGDGMGDSPYTRALVPPNGTEPYSLLAPSQIPFLMVPILTPIPLPSGGSNDNVHSIDNQTLELDSGILYGNITIVDSTLRLAKTGSVSIGGNGYVTIENSTLTDMGYGFSIGCQGGTYCPYTLLIKNSIIIGGKLNDLNMRNVTIVDSTILDSQGDHAVSAQNAESVTIVNSTISGANAGIKSICTESSAPKYQIYTGDRVDNMLGPALNICPGTKNVTVVDDALVSLSSGIQGVMNGSTIEENTISAPNALHLQSNDSIISDNDIFDPSGSVSVYGGGNLLQGNNITVTSSGSFGVYGNGNIVFQNNFFAPQSSLGGQGTWDRAGDGNYWSAYTGLDPNLDGIGDSAFTAGGITDNYPFIQPNGWLTKFYLTLNTNLPPSTHLTINGSTFSIGTEGTAIQRLGYVASYVISLPESVSLSNGSSLVFVKWSDGLTSPTRTVQLASNSTLSATYTLQAAVVITSTSTSSESTSQSLTPSTSSSTGSTTSFSSGGGGIPEFPFQAVAMTAFITLVVVSYLLLRRRANESRHPLIRNPLS